MQPAMGLHDLTTLLLLSFLILTPFFADAAPQGSLYDVQVLPGFQLPTDGNGQILNDLQCAEKGGRKTPTFKRAHMAKVADMLCSDLNGSRMPDIERDIMTVSRRMSSWDSTSAYETAWIVAQLSIAKGVLWTVDQGICMQLFRRIIDECDTHGEDVKIGGVLETSGLKFFIGGDYFETVE